jgi:hypothetical protein
MIEFTAPTELDRRRKGPPNEGRRFKHGITWTRQPDHRRGPQPGKDPRGWPGSDSEPHRGPDHAEPGNCAPTPNLGQSQALRQTLAADIPLADHLRYFADDMSRKARTPRTTTPRRISTAPRSESRATSKKVPTTRFA